jgi:hypothetical protein
MAKTIFFNQTNSRLGAPGKQLETSTNKNVQVPRKEPNVSHILTCPYPHPNPPTRQRTERHTNRLAPHTTKPSSRCDPGLAANTDQPKTQGSRFETRSRPFFTYQIHAQTHTTKYKEKLAFFTHAHYYHNFTLFSKKAPNRISFTFCLGHHPNHSHSKLATIDSPGTLPIWRAS